MQWSFGALISVLNGTSQMTADEIDQIVSFFGVTHELLGSTAPDWSSAPGFNTLLSGFLRRIKVRSCGVKIKVEGQVYDMRCRHMSPHGSPLSKLLDRYELDEVDIPGDVLACITRAIGVPLGAMAYLSRPLIDNIVSIDTARKRHIELITMANRSVALVNENAARIDKKLGLMPVALRQESLRMPRLRVSKD